MPDALAITRRPRTWSTWPTISASGPRPVGDGYWARRDRPELSTGRVLTVFSYTATWDFQERHPTGDELAYVLEGEVDLLLDTGAGERRAPPRPG